MTLANRDLLHFTLTNKQHRTWLISRSHDSRTHSANSAVFAEKQ